MKIENYLQRTDAKSLKDQSPVEKAKDTAAKTGKEGVSGSLKIDTVTISEQARSLQRALGETAVSQPAGEKPVEVREDKVQAARNGIASGAPLSDEVVEKTAEAILSSGALSDIINARRLAAGAGRVNLEEAGLSDDERMQQIRQRIDSGYYNSPEVASSITDSMLEDLLA